MKRENVTGSSSKRAHEDLGVLLRKYPIEVFQNWTITSGEQYYVKAPIDRIGEVAFHIRSHITALILAGNPAIYFLQRPASPGMTRTAFAFSQLGLETFFTSLVVFVYWLIDARLGRLLSALLSLSFFVSGTLKVMLCLPRPPAPPALRLSEEDRDWAWPSNHALVGTTFPWFIWLYCSSHYDLSFSQSFILLLTMFTWNVGVAWSRVYLGVHSPCDVLGGWTLGVLILFVFGGFATKLHGVYIAASSASHFAPFVLLPALLLLVHPRAWPETQSYGECICVLSGTATIWAGRVLGLSGVDPFVSLMEAEPEAHITKYFLRFAIGAFLILLGRILLKRLAAGVFSLIYQFAGLNFYSYTEMCRRLGTLQATKRFTSRMRFKPIPGGKQDVPPEMIPYDVDLPVKVVTYAFIGFLVGDGCPAIFQLVGI